MSAHRLEARHTTATLNIMAKRTKSYPKSLLPKPVLDKINKANYTRGAGDATLYQNRVSRNGVVVIPQNMLDKLYNPKTDSERWERGFIVAIDPEWYFQDEPRAEKWLTEHQLSLGQNAVLAFQRRADWRQYANDGTLKTLANGNPFTPIAHRTPLDPQGGLGGNYIARVSPSTSTDTITKESGSRGLNKGDGKGLGIRAMEYSSKNNLQQVAIQLEYLFWKLESVREDLLEFMEQEDIAGRYEANLSEAKTHNLHNTKQLYELRTLDDDEFLVCPLCLERLHLRDFMSRNTQAEGREIHNLTSTQVTLFHINELRSGKIMHKPYNLGWGHDHCNMVVKDRGIPETLRWMDEVVAMNTKHRGSMKAEAASVEQANPQSE